MDGSCSSLNKICMRHTHVHHLCLTSAEDLNSLWIRRAHFTHVRATRADVVEGPWWICLKSCKKNWREKLRAVSSVWILLMKIIFWHGSSRHFWNWVKSKLSFQVSRKWQSIYPIKQAFPDWISNSRKAQETASSFLSLSLCTERRRLNLAMSAIH